VIAAAVAAAATVTVALVFANIIRAMIRQHARERDLMLNQIMHLSGKPWQEPPRTTPPAPPRPRDTIRSPEQLPEHEWDQELA
jgi:hypothetical protein